MKIYLARGCLGNNIRIWRENVKNPEKAMKIFLAGVQGWGAYAIPVYYNKQKEPKKSINLYLAESGGCLQSYIKPTGKLKDMDIKLATPHSYPEVVKSKYKISILESFYYIKDWMDIYIKDYWNFMLDSGAFTFMKNIHKKEIDWDKYVEDYAEYINKLDIKLFIELDIDNVIGLKEVERLRNKLEKLTNKKSIPVWHKSRGKDYWLQMIKEYDYVAIGGIVTKEIRQKDYKYFRWFLETAKKQNCKIHGLGFTNLEGLKKYSFYSVDSTAWIYGNRGGFLYKFNGKTIDKIQAPDGKRLKGRETAIHNFSEWVKFQKYADKNL